VSTPNGIPITLINILFKKNRIEKLAMVLKSTIARGIENIENHDASWDIVRK